MKVRFGHFTLDEATRQLTRGGDDVHLSTKAFDLLVRLVVDRPAVVDKAILRNHLWPNTYVVDASLTNLVAEIRSALDDRSASSPLIRTVHGVGYAFAGEARDVGTAGPDPGAGGARCWLVWKGRAIVLTLPETVIGRDPGCTVWIDAPGVSRRHARIRVDANTAVLDDLDSTNGTFLGATPVKTTAALKDGDRIRLGKATLTFRAADAPNAPTKRVKPPK